MIRFLLISILATLAMADVGVDTLALPKYTQVVKDNLPKDWWFSSFAETFGDGIKAIHDVNLTGKPKGFRIHLIWSDTHTFGDSDIPKLITLSKKVQLLANKFPNIKCEISPFCEHNLSNPDKYLDIVKANAPSCTPVNTIWKGALSKKYKNEVHGSSAIVPAGNFNWSGDGEDAFNSDIEKAKAKFRTAETFWFWVCSNNGLKCGEPKPRDKRDKWTTKIELEAQMYLTNSKGNAKLSKNYIWKSVSDKHHPECKEKDCKPVLVTLLPVKKASFAYLLLDGKIVEKLPYYGEYRDNKTNKLKGYRYYLSDYGYKKAIQYKNRLLTLSINKVNAGTVNTAFRQNDKDGNPY